MKTLVVAMVATMCGCGPAIRDMAMDTASADHGCPRERVSVTRDASQGRGSSHAYWIDVCGQSRFYRYVPDSDYSGRFVDATSEMR